ncbi:MAG: DegT/DnrJ/EryC1/StrS family aminotransferase [Candidatus Lokiarchaeota archaeon]|nr:DegT/DnrJ/EryC1/StrS family aminotransferase [Candidatus Lokiarchaeota archaeon]
MAFNQEARKHFPEWPQLDKDDYDAVKAVLDSKQLWCGAPATHKGEFVWKFQKEFAEFLGAKHCFAVTNGTHAIEVALLALDIGLGDEVIVPDYTFVATGSAVVAVNAVPILCDVHPRTFNIDETKIEALVTKKTKAIICVHLGGVPCNMDAIIAIAKKHHLKVIEDCAHAHGGKYKGKRLGTIGDIGTFSFQASKVLACGEGGAITCMDDALAENIYGIADAGRKVGEYFYNHYIPSSNYRLGEFQAAILCSQLEKFKKQHPVRNKNVEYLRAKIDKIDGMFMQEKPAGTEECGYYVICVKFDPAKFNNITKKDFYKKLNAAGVPTDDCYPPLHSLACFKDGKGKKGVDYSASNWGGKKSDDKNFPVVVDIFNHSFEFPQEMFLVKDQKDLDYVVDVIMKIKEGKL